MLTKVEIGLLEGVAKDYESAGHDAQATVFRKCIALLSPPAGEYVEVRAAVAVGDKGDWHVYGDRSERVGAWQASCDKMIFYESIVGRCIITARIPLTNPLEISASVEVPK